MKLWSSWLNDKHDATVQYTVKRACLKYANMSIIVHIRAQGCCQLGIDIEIIPLNPQGPGRSCFLIIALVLETTVSWQWQENGSIQRPMNWPWKSLTKCKSCTVIRLDRGLIWWLFAPKQPPLWGPLRFGNSSPPCWQKLECLLGSCKAVLIILWL